ncbi:MAG: toll/interleukin-1 receptor domain-containing protein [Anaerolineae bacterium]|nr:toll/interleukin-1 receptor domain-containing protein [Anaerolineae bacterium]
MPHIFISYAKKDTRQLAETLQRELSALPGVSVWMDISLEAGDSWAYQIQKEIDRSDYELIETIAQPVGDEG